MAARKDRIDLLGGSFLLIISILLGLNQVLIKLVNAGLQPVFQAGLRSACAFLPVLIFAVIARRKLSLSDGSFWPGIWCGLLFSFEFLLLFQSLDYTSVSRASVFFYTMPFWLAAAAHFLIPGERLTLARVVGLGLAIAGIAWAFLDNDQPVSDRALIGDIGCLVAAMFWAGIILLVRTTKLSQSSPEMQLLYQLAVSSFLLTALSPLFGPLIRELTPTIVALFSFQVVAVICIGFLVWFWVLSIYPASDMASFSFLTPLFGVLFGWLILDEPLTSPIIGALVMVSLGIFLINRKPKPPN